jgi:hypothetical protein
MVSGVSRDDKIRIIQCSEFRSFSLSQIFRHLAPWLVIVNSRVYDSIAPVTMLVARRYMSYSY